jgi:hypothetical protein
MLSYFYHIVLYFIPLWGKARMVRSVLCRGSSIPNIRSLTFFSCMKKKYMSHNLSWYKDRWTREDFMSRGSFPTRMASRTVRELSVWYFFPLSTPLLSGTTQYPRVIQPPTNNKRTLEAARLAWPENRGSKGWKGAKIGYPSGSPRRIYPCP